MVSNEIIWNYGIIFMKMLTVLNFWILLSDTEICRTIFSDQSYKFLLDSIKTLGWHHLTYGKPFNRISIGYPLSLWLDPIFFLMGYLKEKVYLEIWTIFKQRTRNWGNLSRLVSTGHCTFLVLLCGGAERLLDNGIFYIIFITVFHSFKIQIKFISNITIRFWVAELLIFHKIETFRHTLYFVWL